MLPAIWFIFNRRDVVRENVVKSLLHGINMHAKTVVSASLSKRRDSGHSLLSSNTLLHMAGRANFQMRARRLVWGIHWRMHGRGCGGPDNPMPCHASASRNLMAIVEHHAVTSNSAPPPCPPNAIMPGRRRRGKNGAQPRWNSPLPPPPPHPLLGENGAAPIKAILTNGKASLCDRWDDESLSLDRATAPIVSALQHIIQPIYLDISISDPMQAEVELQKLREMEEFESTNSLFASDAITMLRPVQKAKSKPRAEEPVPFVQKSPEWVEGRFMWPKTLCNAYGVRFKSCRLIPEYRPTG
eukprot:Gb_00242 [translate_table: standard]